MIVTVGAVKGGTGKTTTAIMLASLLAQEGPTVLIDGDRQGSALTWWRQAEQYGDTWPESLSIAGWRDPLTVPPLGHVVIDTGPGDVPRLREALALSTLAIVPVGCRVADVAQIGQTLDVVTDAASRNRDLAVGVLLTMVRLGTYEATEVPETLNTRDVPVLDTVITERRQYARLFGAVPYRFGAYADLLAELREPAATEVTS